MYKAKVNYSHLAKIQASELREKLEYIGISKYKVTISFIDAENMYLSMKLTTINKYTRYFIKLINTAKKKTINLGLELIHFGMISTLISFDGE